MAGTPPSEVEATTISPTRILLTWRNNDAGYNYRRIQVWRQKFTLVFDGGSVEPQINEILTGQDSGKSGKVVSVNLESGNWGAGTAVGKILLSDITGQFQNNEDVDGNVGGVNILTVNDTDPAGAYTQIRWLEGFTESYQDSSLDTEAKYCYYVVGEWIEPPETTDDSDTDCATTYAELEDPSDLVVEAFADFIELTWKDNSSAEDEFRIERSVDGGVFAYYATVAANVTYYRDTIVDPGKLYAYQVYAREVGPNDSGMSNVDSDTALSAPSAPVGLALEVSANWIRLTWISIAGRSGEIASAGEIGFKIEKSTNGAFGDELEEFIVGPGVTNYLAKDLNAGTRYWFRVRAYNGVGNSAYDGPENAWTLVAHVRSDFEVMARNTINKAVYIAALELKMTLSGFTWIGITGHPVYGIEIAERGVTVDHVWEDGGDGITEGEEYTERTAAELVHHTSSFYWDAANRILYVHSSDSTTPDNFFMEAGFTHLIPNRDFQYADTLCTLPPWLITESIPGTSQETKPYYEGNFSLSSGSISFENGESEGENYFDKRFERFTWIGRKLGIYCGKETFSTLAKFKKMFTAYISGQPCTDKRITFPLLDIRDSLERNLVLNRYSLDDYPDIDEDFIGNEIPLAFGLIPAVTAVPVEGYDAATGKSAIFNFHDGRSKTVVQVLLNGSLQTEDTHYYVDLKRSLIVFDVGQAIGEEDIVKVSFVASVDFANDRIANGAEVFKCLMNNKAGLKDSRLNLDSIYETKYANENELSVYFFKDTAFNDIIRNIEHTVEAFTMQDGEGRLGIRPPQTIMSLSARDIGGHQIFEHSQNVDKNSLYWKVNVLYRVDPQSQNWETESDQDDEIFWKYGVKKELPIHTYFSSSASAQALATSILNLLNKSYIKDKLPMILFDVFPGDLVNFSRTRFYDASGTASDLEIRLLKIEKNPQDGTTRIRAEKV